jgi:hypothetical protein
MERKTESIARCLSLLDKIRPFKNYEYYREWLSECEETELEEREIARLSESRLESALWELE